MSRSHVAVVIACVVGAALMWWALWGPSAAVVEQGTPELEQGSPAPPAPSQAEGTAAPGAPAAPSGPADRPLHGFKPEKSGPGEARKVRVELAGGPAVGSFWPVSEHGRPLVVMLSQDVAAADWLEVVNALGETMRAHVGALDGADLRGGARVGDARAAVRRFRGLASGPAQTIVIAVGAAFQRVLIDLGDEDGLIVIGVSPELSEAAAEAVWARPELPWSLMLVASAADTEAAAVMDGRRPRTMIPRVVRVPGAVSGVGLLRDERVIASLRGWLFGLVGGHG